MVAVNVPAELPCSPEKAWATVSDLHRFDEWLTIHRSWQSEIPETIGVGTKITEVVVVLGMSNKIEWTVEEYDEPRSLRISGTGMAGVQVSFTLTVEPDGDGAKAAIDLNFSGQLLAGPIGSALAKSTRAELEKSVGKLTELLT